MTTPNSEEIGVEVVQNGQSTVEGGEETTAVEDTKERTTNSGEPTNAGTIAGSGDGKDEKKEEANDEAAEGGTENGATADLADERALGTKTPPASQQRQTPPLSANIRAPIVRKRCSAVFGTQTSHSSTNSGGGLSALTTAMLGKKPRKQSVLDNAASGWRAFVQEEQLEQEMESHLRSKDAYLDKQEFLLRADYSQFERERDLRAQERRVQQQQANGSNKPS